MISRTTILLVLIVAAIPLGIHRFEQTFRDGCSAYFAGIPGAPMTEIVESGDRMMQIPCNFWLMRQPLTIQAWSLTWLVAIVLLLVSLINDLRDLRDRRATRQARIPRAPGFSR